MGESGAAEYDHVLWCFAWNDHLEPLGWLGRAPPTIVRDGLRRSF